MKLEDERRLCDAMEAIRAIETELEELDKNPPDAAHEREAEIWDDLLTLDMGIGPLRRQLAIESTKAEDNETRD